MLIQNFYDANSFTMLEENFEIRYFKTPWNWSNQDDIAIDIRGKNIYEAYVKKISPKKIPKIFEPPKNPHYPLLSCREKNFSCLWRPKYISPGRCAGNKAIFFLAWGYIFYMLLRRGLGWNFFGFSVMFRPPPSAKFYHQLFKAFFGWGGIYAPSGGDRRPL